MIYKIISSYIIFLETLDLKDGSCGRGILKQSHLWFAHAENSSLKAQLQKYGLSLGEVSDCSSFQHYFIAPTYLFILCIFWGFMWQEYLALQLLGYGVSCCFSLVVVFYYALMIGILGIGNLDCAPDRVRKGRGGGKGSVRSLLPWHPNFGVTKFE